MMEHFKLKFGALIFVIILVAISGIYVISEDAKSTEIVVETLQSAIERKESDIEKIDEIILLMEEKASA